MALDMLMVDADIEARIAWELEQLQVCPSGSSSDSSSDSVGFYYNHFGFD
jgi:hypothetical protein